MCRILYVQILFTTSDSDLDMLSTAFDLIVIDATLVL